MHDYSLFNAGVMAMPIDLPGFTYWRAVRAVQRIIAILADCAKQVGRQEGTGRQAGRQEGKQARTECQVDTLLVTQWARDCLTPQA